MMSLFYPRSGFSAALLIQLLVGNPGSRCTEIRFEPARREFWNRLDFVLFACARLL